ncbi:MAG: BatD family protein [Acidobacteria bacterium]|nr:BatD family protein [Acidobacteriota bacterium]
MNRIFLLLILLIASPVAAEVSIEGVPETVETGELFDFDLVLEGDDWSKAPEEIDASNVTIDGPPDQSTEYRRIDGEVERIRRYRYRAVAGDPGPAWIGPIVFNRGASAIRVHLNVMESSVRAGLAQRLAGPGPWLIARTEDTETWEGAQVIVSWDLVSEEAVTRTVVQEVPDTDGFLVEEIDPGDDRIERIAGKIYVVRSIKRLALVPLSAGEHDIGYVEVIVNLDRSGRWTDLFGARLPVSVRRRSRPLTISVAPRPPGARHLGKFEMECSRPTVSPAGPVVMDVRLRGEGNLRTVRPPAWNREIDALTRIEPGPVSWTWDGKVLGMSRNWRYLIFPKDSGAMDLSELTFSFFDTGMKTERTVSCRPHRIIAMASRTPPSAPDAGAEIGGEPPETRRVEGEGTRSAILIAGALALAAVLGLSLLIGSRRRSRLRRRIEKELLVAAGQSDSRQSVERVLVRHGLRPEDLEAGVGELEDTWRSVVSAIDERRREPWRADELSSLIAARLGELADEMSRR